MNAPTNQSEGTSRRSIQSKKPNSTDKRLPSIDTPVSTSMDSHSKPTVSLFTKKNMIETVIPSSNEDPTEEYDEDYWKERAIEIAMQDDR
ncbi:hypothetical protein DY000_02031083 [Brassica cretica]|uniref:Uncharacterized protein n=1 Tax=Brassica cretica TaxID=69181 RepID=A0ABQ7DSD5_BRACR|nr:hypothetical protein DY000_02031083 [Brassica cretica]